MYREKLMKALLQMEQAYTVLDGMKQELYRNQEALRSLLIAFLMVLVYNADYSELLTLVIFGHHFYKALIIVTDNYAEHNEDIHVVDQVNVVGQETVQKETVVSPPPNSPEISGFEPTKAGVFATGDSYESVEDMKHTPMEEKLKEYVKDGILDEKVVQRIILHQRDDLMAKYSQMGLERMTQKDYDPTTLENVEGFADMNSVENMETHEAVNFPSPSVQTQKSFDKRIEEYMKSRDDETVKPSSKLSVVSLEFDKRMEEYIKTGNLETSGSTEFDKRMEEHIKNREVEKAKQLLHEEQLDVRQNEIVAAE